MMRVRSRTALRSSSSPGPRPTGRPRRARGTAIALGALLLAAACADAAEELPNTNPNDPSSICRDGSPSEHETDVDCGKLCPPCPDGKLCEDAGDCQSGVCLSNHCIPPACDDGVENGLETDLDCGGGCRGCPEGYACSVGDDCESGGCRDGVCINCSDNARDGDETGIDCGGSCPPCPAGERCATALDCQTPRCDNNICASCEDRVRTGDETDVDCGGSCPACPDGAWCGRDQDCLSNRCDAEGTCGSCSDGAKNGDEGDVDCGGSCPNRCPTDATCNGNTDCESNRCLPGGVCDCTDCPPGMARLGAACTCMDRYEATLYAGACGGAAPKGRVEDDYGPGFPDYVTSEGLGRTAVVGGVTYSNLTDPNAFVVACSEPNSVPSGHLTWFQAKRACENAGKRMCTGAEWYQTCVGPGGYAYPYGSYSDTACNGFARSGGAVCASGSIATCHGNGYADTIFDLSGNVYEWVNAFTGSKAQARGGSSYSGQTQLSCNSTEGDVEPYRSDRAHGVRCCLDLE